MKSNVEVKVEVEVRSWERLPEELGGKRRRGGVEKKKREG